MKDGHKSGDGFGNGSSRGGKGGPDAPRRRRTSTCSFCGKTHREVGPMVEGPNDAYICASCVDLCQNIIRQERRKSKGRKANTLGLQKKRGTAAGREHEAAIAPQPATSLPSLVI